MTLRFVVPAALTPELCDGVVSLWTDVSNAGGAVGFAGPVTRDEVDALARTAFAGVAEGHDQLLVGFAGEHLVAALFLVGNRFALKEHWGTLKRVMVHPDRQGHGYGRALMREAERVAGWRGWHALQVTVRGGPGLERFYLSLGYRQVGVLPGAIRVAPQDDRDEILMWRELD